MIFYVNFSVVKSLHETFSISLAPFSKNAHRPTFVQQSVVANIYLFKVSNRNARNMFEIFLESTIDTPEWHHCFGSGVFIVNFEHISLLFLFFLFLTLNR